ncbi:MAG: universal stress protein [Nocardioides sp.]
MGTIVLGYVPKPEGDAALACAVAEARRRGARLVVVNTQPADPVGAAPPNTPVLDTAVLDASGVSYEVRTLGPANEAAEELIAIAEGEGAELIVIGLKRRSPVGKLILGSSAQRILLDAGCPVLSVKVASP